MTQQKVLARLLVWHERHRGKEDAHGFARVVDENGKAISNYPSLYVSEKNVITEGLSTMAAGTLIYCTIGQNPGHETSLAENVEVCLSSL